jgi:predicted GTPase
MTSITGVAFFENIERWISLLSSANEELPPIVLAVNKIDLMEKAELPVEQIEHEYFGRFTGFFLVSAVTGEQVNNLFMFAAQVGFRFTKQNQSANMRFLLEKQKVERDCC